MNAINSPRRGLYWKEIRQVTPLVLMLVGVALLLLMLWSALQATSYSMSTIGRYIPLILPALYAAGAGAILVGQEKETRTLLWFSSLPIAPSQIVRAKFVVALGGLVVMWVCCALIGSFVGIAGPAGNGFMLTPGDAGFANSLYWLLHSVFVLCCGFYTTWKLKSTFTSLVALIPLAVLPYMVTQIYYGIIDERRYISIEESAWVLAVTTMIGIGIVAWLGYRAAMKDLSPQESELEASGPAQWLAAWRPANSVPIPETPFRFPISSLVWQSLHHNRLALVGLLLAIMCGSISMGLVANQELMNWAGGLVIGGWVVGFIGVSWLGVFAFNGDGSSTRLRFLADRGVSPTRVWIGRQLIGISIVSLATLVYLLASYWTLADLRSNNHRLIAPSMALVACSFWVVYALSQWTSQLIRIVAASAFVAPIVSAVALFWFYYTAIEYNAPFWLLALCSVIPMFVTWSMMRRFMDDNVRWPIFGSGLVAAGLVAFLPAVPFMIDIATWPRLTAEARSRLVAEAMRVPAPAAASHSMMRSGSGVDELQYELNLSADKALRLIDSQDYSPQGFLAIGDLTSHQAIPLTADAHILSEAEMIATSYRFRLRESAEDGQAIDAFGEWMDALINIAKRLRLSGHWLDQEAADRVEIWLTQTLNSSELQPLLNRDFAQRAIELVSDDASRSEARRRAVLLSWRKDRLEPKTLDDSHDYYFGGFYKYRWLEWYSEAKRLAIMDSSLDRLTDISLRLIAAGSAGENTEPLRRELHELLVRPSIAFANGPYSEKFSNANLGAFSSGYSGSYPAMQWYTPWETEAKQLAEFLSSRSEVK